MLTVLFLSLQSLAQETAAVAATAQTQPPAWMQFVPFVIIIAVFYIFLIRPQAKKQKETQSFLSGLKSGDQVITQSGILGKVTGMNEQVVTLEIASQVMVKVLRTQIMAPQSMLNTAQPKKEGN